MVFENLLIYELVKGNDRLLILTLRPHPSLLPGFHPISTFSHDYLLRPALALALLLSCIRLDHHLVSAAHVP
jgi:hypothetical protein